jgi:CRISPR/Cas system-associated endonuclease Cas1
MMILLASSILLSSRFCRTLVRRNDPEAPRELLALMARLAKDAEEASSSESLLGIEGAAAEAYFSRFDHLLNMFVGFC